MAAHRNMQSKNLTKLTKEQRRIVISDAVRLLVNAVAGSGKTETLCAGIRWLLDQGVDPKKILVLCFGTKTAEELRTRIGSGVMVSTLHAYANSLVQSATDQTLTVANTAQQLKTLNEAIKASIRLVRTICNGGVDLREVKELNRLLKFLRATHGDTGLEQRLVSDPDSGFANYADLLGLLRKLYRRFRRRLADNKLISFPDMLRLGKHALQNQGLPYSHVFVDEYQDMDVAQLTLLLAIADKAAYLRIFGDPNQAIFSFMGTQFDNVAGALNAEVVTLSVAHRLTHSTAALASAILGGMTIKGVRGGGLPAFAIYDSQRQQERSIVHLIDQLKADGVSGDQIAILARTRIELRQIERVLLNAGHAVLAAQRTSQLEHMQRMLDLLRWLNKNADTLRDTKLTKAQRLALEARIDRVTRTSLAKERSANARRNLVAAARAPSFEGRFNAVGRVYLAAIRTFEPSRKEVTWSEVKKELNLWQPIAGRFKSVKVFRAFVENMRAEPSITLSTIHSAKGKEWEHVIVVNVTDGVIPHIEEIRRNAVEEERRLFYVAITRARRRLYLFQAPVAQGRITHQKRSRFLSKAVRMRLTMNRPGPSRHL